MKQSIKTLASFGKTAMVKKVRHNALLENQKLFDKFLDKLLNKGV
ncbi:hypothetical protein J6TS1_29740 [Siminovitchia terrae]|uniref:Uncharacterized protein n=1 Tax=Siminovitchia terrae TaxID=1914933 RepID=A0ABQ4KZL3_SIMTE|nr:hypothetical protein J6TS1_29740 [Siminovitchia terrae]